tara:strand:- start:449 stop:751 length:303 start_codon:yes stop_codon:yes gene_type:complete
MAITYTWTIPTVDRTVSTGGIDTIHWRCRAVDGGHSTSVYGTVGCTPDPSASDFIAYDKVTEANCIAWAQADVGKDDTEAALAAQIALLKAPTQASGVPW